MKGDIIKNDLTVVGVHRRIKINKRTCRDYVSTRGLEYINEFSNWCQFNRCTFVMVARSAVNKINAVDVV